MSSSVMLPQATSNAGRHQPIPAQLRSGLFVSAGVHVILLAALIFWSTRPEPVRPPVYRVNLIGAPPGARQVGVVNDKPAAPTQSPKPAPRGAEQLAPPPKALPADKNAKSIAPPPKATPLPAKSTTAGSKAEVPAADAAPPKAASGTQGGKGADVATVRTEGVAFPDQAYLDNIVRQLTLAWETRPISAALVTEVKFTIHRDGTVTDIDVVKRSGDRRYDIDAQGAIEVVGSRKRFGALPAVWKDDVLIVYFTFDYALLK